MGIMAEQLVDFFRARKVRAPSPDIDWTAKRDSWIEAVESLYELVKEMLRDSINSNDVTVRMLNREVTEDFLETYSIPALELSAGNERVEFRPKGVTVIGAAGRVDVVGERGTVTLLWDKESTASGWIVVLQRIPTLARAPLDQKTLQFALERVMSPLP